MCNIRCWVHGNGIILSFMHFSNNSFQHTPIICMNSSQILADRYYGIPFPALPYFFILCRLHNRVFSWSSCGVRVLVLTVLSPCIYEPWRECSLCLVRFKIVGAHLKRVTSLPVWPRLPAVPSWPGLVSTVLPVQPSSQLLSSSNNGGLALRPHGDNALTWVTYCTCFGLLLWIRV